MTWGAGIIIGALIVANLGVLGIAWVRAGRGY